MTLDIMPYGGKNWAVIQWAEYEPTGKRPFRVVEVCNNKNKARKKVAALTAKIKAQNPHVPRP